MAAQVRAGIESGALGFTTSRTYLHRTKDGAPLGTRFSSADELLALAGALNDAGAGVIQLISDAYQSTDHDFAVDEMKLMRAVAAASGRPLSMTVQQPDAAPERWREMQAWAAQCTAEGVSLKTQVAPRPIGVLEGLTASLHPLVTCPSFREIAHLPLAEQVAAARPGAPGPPDRRARRVARPPRGPGRRAGRRVPQDVPDGGSGRLRAVAGRLDRRSRRRRRRVARGDGHRPDARARRQPADVHAADELHRRQPRRRARDAAVAGGPDGSVRRRGALRGDQRREHDHHRAVAVGQEPHAGREAAAGTDGQPHHPAHRRPRRLARSWRRRPRLPRRPQRHRPRRAGRPPAADRPRPAGRRSSPDADGQGYRHTFKGGVETFADGEHTGAMPGALVRGARALAS